MWLPKILPGSAHREAQIGTREEAAVIRTLQWLRLAANGGSGCDPCPGPGRCRLRLRAAALLRPPPRRSGTGRPSLRRRPAYRANPRRYRYVLSRAGIGPPRRGGRGGPAGRARQPACGQRGVGGGAVALTYDNRTLASYPAPAETDTAGWAATSRRSLPPPDRPRRNSRRCRPKRSSRRSWTA